MNQHRAWNFTKLVLSLLLITGCDDVGRGFRFYGTYVAPQSGFYLHLISQGYVVSGADLSENAVAWVQICPLAETRARPFKLSLTSIPGSWNVMTSPDLMLVPTELKSNNAEGFLRDLLRKMGYENALSNEITGSVRVMESALSGPKGVILKGQIDSIQVLETKIDYGYSFDQSQPSATWVQPQELEPCQ